MKKDESSFRPPCCVSNDTHTVTKRLGFASKMKRPARSSQLCCVRRAGRKRPPYSAEQIPPDLLTHLTRHSVGGFVETDELRDGENAVQEVASFPHFIRTAFLA